ncbi:hypothetical protein RM844_21850 [Streptomyces sp. DSM 44915]|uniref:Uncharacterized protein n=1 Tax=Streptomyces chisholmiae TaxID=3075540 RepID=A0ABU2JVD2_9ACTN|nr:hypothetical protein [Streptomyces sp. DSM 44915]MDT0268936.1 hypothetical protein [Streptomyces sp. DSM 44915]
MAHITGERHAPIAGEHAPDPVHLPPRQPVDPVPEPGAEPRGCLFAVSQPPLMLFLSVIGALLLIAGVHDQFWL